jgi:hypothetical protein
MIRTVLVNDQIYHVFNRGVEKSDIFLDDQNYLRFINNLYQFNDENPVINTGYYFDPETMNGGKTEENISIYLFPSLLFRKRKLEILMQHKSV